MSAALLIDFGSTYTKLRAVDLATGRVLGAGEAPSTVETDVIAGMQAALDDLERRLGALPEFRHRLASSSAAGGLAMVTVGLVPELTAEAARRAALGAGARLAGTFAYRLTAGDVDAILELTPDIVLLAGGTDGGNADVITDNAAALAASPLACPVVVAGNRNAADGVAAKLDAAGKVVTVTGNVMPEFGVLDVEPARAELRRIFIERIVHAKGIDRAQAMFDAVLMPTPAAVMEGARLLADGTEGRAGLGPLVVVDVGGATTDVHSIGEGAPTDDSVVRRGLPEPYVKRTVEGDLGMRYNAPAVAQAIGLEGLAADAGLEAERVSAMVGELAADVARLPGDDDGRALDRALARAAVRLAVQRHAGTLETVHTATGPVQSQHGKDLGPFAAVIGTGGVLVHGADAAAVLATACAAEDDPFSLRPRHPRLLIDGDYVLFACGLLASVDAEAAMTVGLGGLQAVTMEDADGRISAA